MPLDELPGEFVIPARDDIIEKAKRDWRARTPALDPSDPQVDVFARVLTDALLPVYVGAKIAGQNAVLEAATGDKAIAQHGEREAVEGPFDAVGGSGTVEVVASSGGTALVAGDELVHEASNTTYKVTIGGTYFDGDPCPVTGISTGPQTNLAAGTVLKWKNGARPGSGETVTVIAQIDGSGLSGGRPAETAIDYRERIREEKKNKAASGNDSDYQQTSGETPGIGIQKVFTIPTILGPGTTAVLVTLNPSKDGGSRIPNSTHMATIEQYVVGKMPADDGPFFCLIVEQDVDNVVYRVTWDIDAAGWMDFVQWPPYYPPDSGSLRSIVVSGDLTPTATTFRLRTANDNYALIAVPSEGQTFGFYDRDNAKFVKKRIGSIAGVGPWTITVDQTNAASDTLYVPFVGQRPMPWSESLQDIVPTLIEYFKGLGPGEQVSTFYDEGRRQRRQPQAPKEWPHTLTQKGLDNVIDIPAISNGTAVEGDGVAPDVGSPGVFSNMLRLRDVSVFPK